MVYPFADSLRSNPPSASVASPARLSPNAPLGDPVSVTGGFWDSQWDYTGIGILVGGAITILKNMKVNGKDYPI
jgi:hypothetical protein